MAPLPTRPVVAGIYSRRVRFFGGYNSLSPDFAWKKTNDNKCL